MNNLIGIIIIIMAAFVKYEYDKLIVKMEHVKYAHSNDIRGYL